MKQERRRLLERATRSVLALTIVALTPACAPESEVRVEEPDREVAVRPDRNPLRDAYFGDLHVHTSYSIDSYIFGNRLGPRDAYRFALGEPVELYGGATQQLATPLDFAAVTDHAEGLDIYALCAADASSPRYDDPFCAGIRAGDLEIFQEGFLRLSQRPPERFQICEGDDVDCREIARGPWQEIQRIADEFYAPGEFTALIGFEYSPTLEAGGMLHRNVIFRGTEVTRDAAAVWEVHTQADLWRWLENACTGECQALAIPHNTNYSWGLAFAETNDDGREYTPEDWRRRARAEPIVELFQHKGNSECAVGLGTADEECGFEQIFPLCGEGQETGCARETSYVRNALKQGLLLVDQLGFNPYRLGFIGSTDTHNALAGGTDEATFQGHHANNDDTPRDRLERGPRAERPNVVMNPGGLAAVWAEENTREAIFDALRRREAFATSGPRIRVRLFGGFDYPEDLPDRDDWLAEAYERGVAMGGDLQAADERAPRFLVWATKDPRGANLQRIQMVKGWTENGEVLEKVLDIACSDGLSPDPATGRCPDNGASVDPTDCSISEELGATELSTLWTDPEFQPDSKAFYYVRVLANPTCRWSTWEALGEGMEVPTDQPRTIQERAWSSPIWISP